MSACYSSAATAMQAPPEFFTSGAFSDRRWTFAGEQRDERCRLFTRKLLNRLDGMRMPFYVKTGLMDLRTAKGRYDMGIDPWTPMESPFLDGVAIEIEHVHPVVEMTQHCWELIAEIAFDVARLAQISIVWGGLGGCGRPGLFVVIDNPKAIQAGFTADKRTYRFRG